MLKPSHSHHKYANVPEWAKWDKDLRCFVGVCPYLVIGEADGQYIREGYISDVGYDRVFVRFTAHFYIYWERKEGLKYNECVVCPVENLQQDREFQVTKSSAKQMDKRIVRVQWEDWYYTASELFKEFCV